MSMKTAVEWIGKWSDGPEHPNSFYFEDFICDIQADAPEWGER